MKCDNCKYCHYDRADDMYLCDFGWESEDSKGNCGCRYNQKTLDKKYREYWEQETKDALAMSKYCERKMNNDKSISTSLLLMTGLNL